MKIDGIALGFAVLVFCRSYVKDMKELRTGVERPIIPHHKNDIKFRFVLSKVFQIEQAKLGMIFM